MIENFNRKDKQAVIDLWNINATKIGYKELNEVSFDEIFLKHPNFNSNQAFVVRKEDRLVGFACGCMGEELPLGKTSGYLTCIILEEQEESGECYAQLLGKIEETFRQAGKAQSEVLFFNPMMLPWYIRGTDKHEHNNAPGVFKNSRLYQELLANGYMERATEQAMYLNLEEFKIPDKIKEKEARASLSGYEVALFQKETHTEVAVMLDQLDNPLWKKEILTCCEEEIPVLVAAKNGKVVGFAGPMIRQPNGRGYFTGIGVVKEHEGHGLGTILFYKLCQEEKEVGAAYMSLYTGADNPAGKIYTQAGFVTVEEFAVMRKML